MIRTTSRSFIPVGAKWQKGRRNYFTAAVHSCPSHSSARSKMERFFQCAYVTTRLEVTSDIGADGMVEVYCTITRGAAN